MRVLIVGDKDGREKWLPYARVFVSEGWEVTLLFYYRNERQTRREMVEPGIEEVVISQPDSFDPPDHEYLSRLENEYDLHSVPQYAYTEVFLYNRQYTEVAAELSWLFPQVRELFERESLDLVLQNQGAGLIRRSAFSLAQKRGVPCIYFDVSWFGDRMFLPANEMNEVEEYRPIPSEKLSSETRVAVDAFRRAQLESKQAYQYQFRDKKRIDALSKTADAYRKLLRKNLKKSFSYRVARIKTRGRGALISLLYDRLNRTGIPTERFFYFPLHYPKDSQLTLRNQLYMRQEALVEFIAWNLPHGTRLLVKAHPQAKGDYTLGALGTIKRMDRTSLVPASISTHDLLSSAHCAGVVTLNSSVGFEALLYKKPVVALGNFYGLRYDQAIYNIEPGRLSATLREVSQMEPEPEQFLGALGSIYQSSYPGTIYAPQIDYSTVVNSVLRKREALLG